MQNTTTKTKDESQKATRFIGNDLRGWIVTTHPDLGIAQEERHEEYGTPLILHMINIIMHARTKNQRPIPFKGKKEVYFTVH